jgi:hypothetical protein
VMTRTEDSQFRHEYQRTGVLARNVRRTRRNDTPVQVRST